MDKVSIIVPVFKAEKYLEKCVNSILKQTYSELEIILVDDGSPDSCPKICDNFAKKSKKVKVIHKKNAGVSKAIIDGINSATGKYITFLDSDDYVVPEFIEKLYKAIKENNADISVCNYTRAYDDREESNAEIKDNIVLEKGKNIENCIYTYTGWNGYTIAPCRWNKLFKIELIKDSLKYVNTEISMGEDFNMTFYAMTMANKVVLINDFLHYYRQVGNSLSNTKRNNWVHYKKVIKQLLIIDEEKELNLKDYIYSTFVTSYIFECVKYVLTNCKGNEIKEFLTDEYLQECVSNIKKDKLKKKIYFWAINHKCITMLKIAVKISK